MNEWLQYIDKTKNIPPRPLLVKAMDFVVNREVALDLGAGALSDTKYLIESGFKKIVALDQEDLAKDIYYTLPKDIVEYVISTFEDYKYPINTFDIVNAQYALPFNPAETFPAVIRKIKDSLKPKGIFVAQLFGVKDEWNDGVRKITFHNRSEIEEFFKDMKILEFNEEEKDQKPVIGDMKHWHIFHIIAQKVK